MALGGWDEVVTTRRIQSTFPELWVSEPVCRDVHSTQYALLPLHTAAYLAINTNATTSPADSKWTAMQRTFGWRHFRVGQKLKQEKETLVLMVSTCDPETRFWVGSMCG